MPYKDPEKRKASNRKAMRRWRSIPENYQKALTNGRMYDKKRYPIRREKLLGYEKIRWRLRQEKQFGVRYPTWWLCDICSKPISLFKGEINLDHDHKTGLFRGWLCFNDNTTVGRLEKKEEGFKGYLKW